MIVLNQDSEELQIDMTHTMYPSSLHYLRGNHVLFSVPDYSTIYGINLEGTITLVDVEKKVKPMEYFCLTGNSRKIDVTGNAVIFVRHGFRGQNMIGGPVENSGRLSYIDNCSDSILIYPPRSGDSSMSLLSFPASIEQRFHIHPSIRLGVIISGIGYAETKTEKFKLSPGVAFCVGEKEVHRFITDKDSGLNAISFHPEGDWGPTDENHAMINRTYEGRFLNK